MIVRPRADSWLGYLFHLPAGSVLLDIKWRLLAFTLSAAGFTWAASEHLLDGLFVTTTPFSIVGVALSIFLGFRNNAAYDRFWEGRKLWGALVNTARSTARETLHFVGGGGDRTVGEPAHAEEQRALQVRAVHLTIAFTHSLRMHLRGESDWSSLPLSEEQQTLIDGEQNKPTAIAMWLGDLFREAWSRGWLDSYHHAMLEQRLVDLTDIQGGCERIRSTPIPVSHTALTHRTTALYLLLLPFGLYETVGVMTPLVVLAIGFAFLGLDAIGDELETPFGYDANDLPLNQLSRMIEINLRQRLGEPDLPAPRLPDANYLLD